MRPSVEWTFRFDAWTFDLCRSFRFLPPAVSLQERIPMAPGCEKRAAECGSTALVNTETALASKSCEWRERFGVVTNWERRRQSECGVTAHCLLWFAVLSEPNYLPQARPKCRGRLDAAHDFGLPPSGRRPPFPPSCVYSEQPSRYSAAGAQSASGCASC